MKKENKQLKKVCVQNFETYCEKVFVKDANLVKSDVL